MFSQQAQQKKLEFNLFISPQIPHFLRGDPVRFSQVIINLVSNAIRFTHHGSVMVWSEVLTETDDVIELLVKVRDMSGRIKSIVTKVGIDSRAPIPAVCTGGWQRAAVGRFRPGPDHFKTTDGDVGRQPEL